MADPRIERLAAQVLEAISDPKVCGQGANALRNTIKRELKKAAPGANAQTNEAINYASGQIAGRVEDICRGLPPNVRAVGVVVAAAGAVYGVTQMPEEEIRRAIANMRATVVNSRINIAGQPVDLKVSTTLAPLLGERPSVNAEARWRQQLFGQPGTARVFANDMGRPAEYAGSDVESAAEWFSAKIGAPVSAPDLGGYGMSVVGARLLGTKEGPLAQFVYEDAGGERYSLTLAKHPDDRPVTPLRVVDYPDRAVGYWSTPDIDFAFIGKTDGGSIETLAADLANRI